MSSFKPIDSKKEEFRKYLEKTGVMDILTKVLVGLYEEPEKPEDALDYLKKYLAGKSSESVELEALRLELCELKDKYSRLQEEHVAVVGRLAKYEMSEVASKTTSSTPPYIGGPSSPKTEPSPGQPADAAKLGDKPTSNPPSPNKEIENNNEMQVQESSTL